MSFKFKRTILALIAAVSIFNIQIVYQIIMLLQCEDHFEATTGKNLGLPTTNYWDSTIDCKNQTGFIIFIAFYLLITVAICPIIVLVHSQSMFVMDFAHYISKLSMVITSLTSESSLVNTLVSLMLFALLIILEKSQIT